MDTNTMVNHWGKWVDKTEPVTGVISFNDVCQFVSDEIAINGIDLQYEEACKEFESEFLTAHNREPDEDEWQEFYNELEGCESGDQLIGDWIKDNEGLYDADPEGEYSAIVREGVVQVIKSIYITKCKNLCSPCYPGQADINGGDDEPEGEFLAYNLPPEAYTY
jgi:hypothetical protein